MKSLWNTKPLLRGMVSTFVGVVIGIIFAFWAHGAWLGTAVGAVVGGLLYASPKLPALFAELKKRYKKDVAQYMLGFPTRLIALSYVVITMTPIVLVTIYACLVWLPLIITSNTSYRFWCSTVVLYGGVFVISALVAALFYDNSMRRIFNPIRFYVRLPSKVLLAIPRTIGYVAALLLLTWAMVLRLVEGRYFLKPILKEEYSRLARYTKGVWYLEFQQGLLRSLFVLKVILSALVVVFVSVPILLLVFAYTLASFFVPNEAVLVMEQFNMYLATMPSYAEMFAASFSSELYTIVLMVSLLIMCGRLVLTMDSLNSMKMFRSTNDRLVLFFNPVTVFNPIFGTALVYFFAYLEGLRLSWRAGWRAAEGFLFAYGYVHTQGMHLVMVDTALFTASGYWVMVLYSLPWYTALFAGVLGALFWLVNYKWVAPRIVPALQRS